MKYAIRLSIAIPDMQIFLVAETWKVKQVCFGPFPGGSLAILGKKNCLKRIQKHLLETTPDASCFSTDHGVNPFCYKFHSRKEKEIFHAVSPAVLGRGGR